MRSTCFGFWSPAIRRISRNLLRSSSTCEPSDPLFGVVQPTNSDDGCFSSAVKNSSIQKRHIPYGTRGTSPKEQKSPPGGLEAQPNANETTFFTRSDIQPNRLNGIGSDPSAGSPTETLLRLLLPLDSQVRPSSRHTRSSGCPPPRDQSEGLTKPSDR